MRVLKTSRGNSKMQSSPHSRLRYRGYHVHIQRSQKSKNSLIQEPQTRALFTKLVFQYPNVEFITIAFEKLDT